MPSIDSFIREISVTISDIFEKAKRISNTDARVLCVNIDERVSIDSPLDRLKCLLSEFPPLFSCHVTFRCVLNDNISLEIRRLHGVVNHRASPHSMLNFVI